jgi:hypothetical protein
VAKPKYDGVIEAVHYNSDGSVKWVRTFLRRGSIWSDYILLDRQELVDYLKSGKRFMAGRRVPMMAGTFEVSQEVRLKDVEGKDVLVSGDGQAAQDHLEGVPLI